MNNEQTTKHPPSRFFGLWPLLLFIVIATWLMARANHPVEPIFCDPENTGSQPDVIMLSAEWCPYCRRARRFFVEENINYCEHDIENSEAGRDLYAQSEIKVIPIITIKKEVLVGFSRAQILQTLASHDLYPLEKI
ncbi:MAG: glutaredoxin family protein [Gammaproteobacteria bacterium]